MNYKLHDNGWTILIEDFDLRTATQEDILLISRLVATNTCVVIKGQQLTLEQEISVLRMFKNPDHDLLFEKDHPDFVHGAVKGTDGMIFRVTGELNEYGKPGIAGDDEELVWHCNHPHRPDRGPLVWLHGVRGTEGSRTSWNNNILSYNDLDQTTKKLVDNLEAYFVTGTNFGSKDADISSLKVSTIFTPKIVQTNIAGKTGLFFPFLQIDRFNGMTKEESQEIIDLIAPHTIQEKYCYHHDWRDGDIVISEQNLGIHKRWPFKHMKSRLLHRAVFDFPDQDYTLGI